MGTKGLLEDLDGSEAASLLSSADYTLCLDSLSMADASSLYVHVSKPPKEGAKGHLLLQYLNQVRASVGRHSNSGIKHSQASKECSGNKCISDAVGSRRVSKVIRALEVAHIYFNATLLLAIVIENIASLKCPV